ncbi:CusA/CzcA family heavy metal efflux RND transporter [Thiocapsa imhoffii]|uniref:CusA/CzcA family heavy metal efflux RND transporter n=1 Tax=Thiocapsa imhoffii TaxID=382777 RepID=A0A9X1B814_9GAMM|nr:efflux RND transporter permease subunit [Thiocapsa imhoffii]MBK1643610.1 CusA/CzcA family heavy metal efflux RND transporter [Thiocapsa imhoffii]
MFDAIVWFSLRQRLLVLGAALLLIVLGLLAFRELPVDVFPDLDRPTVTLMTEAGGLAPEEVEQLVTLPLETAMKGLPNVQRVRSVSGVGLSVIAVEFDWGTDIYRHRQQVAERLTLTLDEIPPGITPHMGPISSIMGEIMLVAVPIDPSQASPMAVREFADWVMRPRLLALPGVAQVIPIGGEVREYRVTPRPESLRVLDIGYEELIAALEDFAANRGGGFLERDAEEVLIRHLGRTDRLEDLQQLAVAHRNGRTIMLRQVADVAFAPALKRGEASFNAAPAVILSIQKQPQVDTLTLTETIESALDDLARNLPAGVQAPRILFKQADFIAASVNNVTTAIRDGAILVAIVLLLFLLDVRVTAITLTAIPLAVLVTLLTFQVFGLSINTMTLGGIAIAIGELVDDAVVGTENVLRRLKQARVRSGYAAQVAEAIPIIARATIEVRAGILYSTATVVLVFVPLFALPGIEGRLFSPLGVAYIVSILASTLVAMTLTPVLCAALLPGRPHLERGDSPVVRHLKRLQAGVLSVCLRAPRRVLAAALLLVVMAAASLPFLPRSFLPAFNEGTLTINLLLNPGVSLSESNRIGTLAEQLILEVPEVTQVGRRTGRAELDEHAEGVHYSEIDVDLRRSERDRDAIMQYIRTRLALLPAAVSIGQPISHRLDHMLSGIRAQIALKIHGDDLDTLRAQAAALLERLRNIPGLTDLQIEKQVLIPQVTVILDQPALARYGMTPGRLLQQLETLTEGRRITQVIEGNRRFDLRLQLADPDRDVDGLRRLPIATPAGFVPLSTLAEISLGSGPNQISRDDGQRRIVIQANSRGGDLSATVGQVREVMARFARPEGYFFALEGQFQAQEEAMRLIAILGSLSVLLVFLALYSRYRSSVLVLIIMGNIPLALIGAVAALWIVGATLSVASLVGFITLAGLSTRNGILKISHYLHLARDEGERFGDALILRGAAERLTPVLMTALVTAIALIPLLVAGQDPGKEILYPVAVVIFGGLISSTLLDTVVTPVLFKCYGQQPLARWIERSDLPSPVRGLGQRDDP